MGRRLEYEVKTSVRLNMSNPQHVKINDVIQNLDPKIFKSKNQFIIDAIQFYIDNYGKETFVIKKKEKERAEYIRSEDIDDIKEVETKAAEGYILDETAHDVTLRYDDNAPDVVVTTLKLVNVPTEPKLPQTGDNANPLLYLGIGALALITGVGVGLRGRKKKNKQ